MIDYPAPLSEQDVVEILEAVVKNDIPLSDGIRRGIWTWVNSNPAVNPIRLYKVIVKHPDTKIRNIELGWAPVEEGESDDIRGKRDKLELKHDFIVKEMMFG